MMGGGYFHLLWRGKTIIRITQNSLPNDYCKILCAEGGIIQGEAELSRLLDALFYCNRTGSTQASAEPVTWGMWTEKARRKGTRAEEELLGPKIKGGARIGQAWNQRKSAPGSQSSQCKDQEVSP